MGQKSNPKHRLFRKVLQRSNDHGICERYMERGSMPCGRREIMRATQILYETGQSIWLDNIRRDLLDSGTLQRYIDELSVTGLTSNPTIFERSLKSSDAYDAAIALSTGNSPEEIFFDLALQDITRAADLFRPI